MRKSNETVYANMRWTRNYTKYGTQYQFAVTAEIHSLGGQAPYFSLTGWGKNPKQRDDEWGGACHDDIVAALPHLEKYVKWHLFAWPTGPMHYVANTLYLAGDRDCWGRRASEPSRYEYQVRFGDSLLSARVEKRFWYWLEGLEVGDEPLHTVAVDHDGFRSHYTVSGYDAKWYECPFKDLAAATEFVAALNGDVPMHLDAVPVEFSEGKERELDAARRASVWPEATDEQLCLPTEELKELLVARLDALLDEFQADMNELFGDQITWVKRNEETNDDDDTDD